MKYPLIPTNGDENDGDNCNNNNNTIKFFIYFRVGFDSQQPITEQHEQKQH